MSDFYGEDLAFIHDSGFGSYARNAVPEILEHLHQTIGHRGLVLDLGCGSGISTRFLVNAGYSAVGYDLSEPLLDIARREVPEAEFRNESIFDAALPPCQAIVAVGEVLCYVQNPDSPTDLSSFMRKGAEALSSGGALVFDIVLPGAEVPKRTWAEGNSWAVLVERTEHERMLERRIIIFRKVDGRFRRSEETHHQQLVSEEEMGAMLSSAGFSWRTRPSELPGRLWFFATKA